MLSVNKTANGAPIHSVRAELGTEKNECVPQSLETGSRQMKCYCVWGGLNLKAQETTLNLSWKLRLLFSRFGVAK